MNFVQVEFLWFMLIVFTTYWALGRLRSGRVAQNWMLLVASCVFYGWIHPWFLGLLVAASLTDFVAARAMDRYPHRKQLLLLISVVTNLGILGYFKYFNFFVQNVIDAFDALGVQSNLSTLSILLPVGISFYTFQTMSYTIDVYRGEMRASSNVRDYLLYVMFFPQLVAGPIERAPRLLTQIDQPRTFDFDRVVSGVSLMMWGGFKKMCIADTIAPYIDKVFVLEDPAGPMVWAAAIGFSIQIFADFSGYTDMARGAARLLGFELTENFKSPYLAATTPEFWQRWHISLSFWIRDYLMVPLLGSSGKLTLFRFVWATILTFTIIGFWHGASWNFILFGVWHGLWMTIYTLLVRYQPAWTSRIPLGRPLAIAFHFLAISTPGSLLFRETHLDRLIGYLQKNPFAATSEEWMAVAVVGGMTMLGATPLIASHFVERWVMPRIDQSPWYLPVQTSTWAVLAAFMFVFYRVSTYDFIYFQF